MNNSAGRWLWFLLLAFLLPMSLSAQEAADFFRENCISCHTIGGGRLTGPDLKDVSERKDRDWLGRFLLNPKAVIDSGDPYAVELFEQARGTVMPTIPGMTPEHAATLLDLIEEESKLEESQFKGLQITDRPFTAEEIEGATFQAMDLYREMKGRDGGAARPQIVEDFNNIVELDQAGRLDEVAPGLGEKFAQGGPANG